MIVGTAPVLLRAENAEKPSTSNHACDFGKSAEEIENARQSLAFVDQSLGKDDPATLKAVSDLASRYRSLGCYYEAEPLYKRILETRERLLGKEHPDTLTSINNLGLLHQAHGQNDKAETLLKSSFEASIRVLGNEHRDTLQRFNHLVEFYNFQGRDADEKKLKKHFLKFTTIPTAETRQLQKAILGCWEYNDEHSKSIDSNLACFNAKRIVNGVTFNAGGGYDWYYSYSIANNLIFIDDKFWGRIQSIDKQQFTLERYDETNVYNYVYKLKCKTENQDIQCARLKNKPDH